MKTRRQFLQSSTAVIALPVLESLGFRRFASAAPVELRGTLSGYLARADEMRGRLVQALLEVQMRVAHAQDELAESYRKSKTLEVTQANRDKEELVEEGRREEADLNEIGLTLFRRREEIEST